MVAAAADPELAALPTSRSSNGQATRDDAWSPRTSRTTRCRGVRLTPRAEPTRASLLLSERQDDAGRRRIVAAGQATAGSRRRQHEETVDSDAGMTLVPLHLCRGALAN